MFLHTLYLCYPVLLEFQLQEMKGNIRVFCRCRYDSRSGTVFDFPSDTQIKSKETGKAFKFDKVFHTTSTQDEAR